MFTRAFVAAALSLSCAALAAAPAHAKGSSAIAAATLSGGKLASPKTIDIRLPESLDDMFELETPPSGGGAALPYELTLHYDFGDEGGLHNWAGRYDGDQTLYFPESMIVRNGVWKGGWYTAVDVLAQALSSALAPPRPPLLPVTGSGPDRDRRAPMRRLELLLLLGIAAPALGLIGSRIRRALAEE